MSFANKVVLLTGGSSGIGAAAAVQFARKGANVAIVGRNEAKLLKTADECEKVGKKALVTAADVTKDAKRIIDETLAAFGKIDVLINNAGVSRKGCIFDEKLIDTYDFVMETNVRAVISMTMLAAPHLKATKGNIINVSSICGQKHVFTTTLMAYSVSKAALDHFTRAAAIELGAYGIRVNGVSPGPVRTDILKNSRFYGTWDVFKKFTLLDKVAEPDEIGELLMFLASDKAKSITGSNYVCDNGFLLN